MYCRPEVPVVEGQVAGVGPGSRPGPPEQPRADAALVGHERATDVVAEPEHLGGRLHPRRHGDLAVSYRGRRQVVGVHRGGVHRSLVGGQGRHGRTVPVGAGSPCVGAGPSGLGSLPGRCGDRWASSWSPSWSGRRAVARGPSRWRAPRRWRRRRRRSTGHRPPLGLAGDSMMASLTPALRAALGPAGAEAAFTLYPELPRRADRHRVLGRGVRRAGRCRGVHDRRVGGLDPHRG